MRRGWIEIRRCWYTPSVQKFYTYLFVRFLSFVELVNNFRKYTLDNSVNMDIPYDYYVSLSPLYTLSDKNNFRHPRIYFYKLKSLGNITFFCKISTLKNFRFEIMKVF